MNGEGRRNGNSVEIANRQRRVPVDVRFYQGLLFDLLVLTRRTSSLVGLTFLNDRQMRRLNRRHRRIDRQTDVLAFPVSARIVRSLKSGEVAPYHVLGDIVISIDTARRQAREAGDALRDECCRLVIHGYLHLLGYDHERSRPEAVRMRRMERSLEARLKACTKNRPNNRSTKRVAGSERPV
jgi:probable rRNA maturation factor